MRNSILHTTGLVVVLCLVGVGGVVHGLMTDRWDLADNSSAITSRFDSFPQQVGEWELKSSEEMSDLTIKMLECDGYLARNYMNGNTGETVKVAVILGPAGPTAVHTPEVCYSSRDYSIEQDRESTSFKGSDGETDNLWKLTLRSHDLNAHRLRVYYGWTTDGTWQADANPRVSFAGEPFLVKVQIAGRILQTDDSQAPDPCLRFLKEFTPQLRKHLFAESQADE